MNTLSFPNSEAGRTISDLETRLEALLSQIQQTSSTTTPDAARHLLSEAKELLTGAGFRAVVQLEEDGRKKRGTAAATNWKMERGEIVIFFEPAATAAILEIPDHEPHTAAAPARSAADPGLPKQPMLPPIAASAAMGAPQAEVQECCKALEAAATGRDFVGFKHFRDLILAGHPYSWAASAEGRQRVLNEAISTGAITTKKIPNPKFPARPTTVVMLNHSSTAVQLTSRFRPVAVTGEPVAETILRERG